MDVLDPTQMSKDELVAELFEARGEVTKLSAEKIITEARAMTDELTDLPNRRAMNEALQRAIDSYKSSGTPCSVLFTDIDHFKWVNDALGHEIGDVALKAFAQSTQNKFRKTDELLPLESSTDLVTRYGGEEFVFILRNTALDGATVKAQRIREMVEALEIELPQNFQLPETYLKRDARKLPNVYQREDGRWILRITISVGVVTISSLQDTPQLMKARADRALYKAKEAGRNRVCIFNEDSNIIAIRRNARLVARPTQRENWSKALHQQAANIPAATAA
jgi:two-component system cell cycle response regulator